MTGAERCGQRGHHRERGGDRGDAQLSGQPVLERLDLLAHGAGVADDPAGPVERALALGCEADEARAALHEQHAERLLELLDAGRERRLRDPAGVGGVTEMPLARQRHQVFQLVEHYRVSRPKLLNKLDNPNDRKFQS